jgi:mannose-6-phosphate isomerase-like protein (cupin superfamily)
MEKAVAHIPPGEGTRSLWVLGELVTHKVPSQQTGGAYSLFEVVTQPGAGPLPHIHHREDESFYVIEGDYEFLIGGQTLRVGADSLLYVPKGTLHTHRGVGKGVGRMLATQTPGGLYERFFEEVGEEAKSNVVMGSLEEGSPEAARIIAVAAQYGIEIALPAQDARPGHSSRPIRDIDS